MLAAVVRFPEGTSAGRDGMRHPALSELGDDILILECHESFRRLLSLDESVPEWVREIRLAYHDCLNAELEARGLPSPGRDRTHTIEALALRVRWDLLRDLRVREGAAAEQSSQGVGPSRIP
jgi:hypothetical protein